MNAPVLHFTPRAELEPHANIDAFVALCKQSEVMGASQQFDLNVWNQGYVKGQNKIIRVIFSTREAASMSAAEPTMPQPFLDFAKATLVYLQDMRPVVSASLRVSALRFLESALRQWNKASRPTAVNVEVLDTAVEIAREHVSAGVAYRIAGQLELIAELMTSKGFISLPQPWSHGVRKPAELGSRISKESLDARQEKLPSAAVLRALAGIFQQATLAPDVLISSFTALMLCAPERINEVLRLIRNCLVEGDGRFNGKLGLRWAGSKGASDTTKWLPTQMVPIAREAIANLLKVSAPAHDIATWYTANPHSLYLHDAAESIRGKEILTSEEVAFVLWGDKSQAPFVGNWVSKKKLTFVQLGNQQIGYRFDEIERAIVAMLPATFPFVLGAPELLCKDSMAVMRTNENHSQRLTYLCMFTCIDYNVISNSFGRVDRRSIFEQFDYTEDDGSPIKLRSHSLRHYLNMLAQLGGLSSAEIAIFSGRKDQGQNRAYDHMSSDEVQAPISRALKAGLTANIVAPSARTLVTRSEFVGLGLLAAHTTEYGWCRHNFASEPCQMYRDCMNCEEQECVKGDEHKETNLRMLKSETEYLLKVARSALNKAEYGADVWVTHQMRTLDRVNALLTILENPDVPVGARVRLNLTNAPLITVDSADEVKLIKFHRRIR